jgi:hypothetical protein
MAAIAIIAGVSSCKCTSDKQETAEPVAEQAELVVENLISMDRQSMYTNHGEGYRWYETGVVLKDFLDEENDGSIEMVVNVFQVVENLDSTSFDTFVYKYQHTLEGNAEDSVHGFWVEDYPLNEEEITVTFRQAYERLMETNLPKPHSRHVVLRKEVGPVDANPQYIFGNSQAQVYVDAVTGEVRNYNPAFPKNAQLNYAFSW